MAQDIRDLLKENSQDENKQMPKNHEDRFLNKLNETFPDEVRPKYKWLNVAASVVILIGLSFGAFQYFGNANRGNPLGNTQTIVATKTLGDVSPDMKKV